MMAEVFPVTLYCDDRSGGGDYRLRPYFLKVKPKDMVWYSFDAIIHSRTEVEFIVFDMKDSVHGGVGQKIARFKTVVPAEATGHAVEQKILDIATARRTAELLAAEAAVVAKYADEIRQKLGDA